MEGERIIVVGGAGAVGLTYVDLAVSRGATVAVLDLPVSLDRATLPDEVLRYSVDVTSRSDVDLAVEDLTGRWGAANGLVYLSGYALSPPRPAPDVTDDEWASILDVNLAGAFRCSTSALQLLRAGQGAIVLVSSAMAFGPVAGFAPYIASKAGMIGLTRALALEFAPEVRVNAIAPSAMDTPFVTGGSTAPGTRDVESWFDPSTFANGIPMGRLADTADCVGAIDFLLSESSAFITGQVLPINGGRFMR
ncbi:SDR family oxidoreductase [Rhodococcus sp. USK13]|uniref:SDR family NAD(P)-dependent oxidoreductase n=1 Tax=Rhodococcus sp. USK13 TaxID=2806442 RepID=UPI001BCF1BE3|nr:SDR family oxidoreductase [Rhodococcus sp. USK13]